MLSIRMCDRWIKLTHRYSTLILSFTPSIGVSDVGELCGIRPDPLYQHDSCDRCIGVRCRREVSHDAVLERSQKMLQMR